MGTYEAGEWEFQEEEVGRALVAADFAEGDGAGPVAADLAGGIFVCGGVGQCQRARCEDAGCCGRMVGPAFVLGGKH